MSALIAITVDYVSAADITAQVRLIYPLAIIAHCAHAAIFYKHADETSTAFWFPVVLGVIIVIAWIVRMPSTVAPRPLVL